MANLNPHHQPWLKNKEKTVKTKKVWKPKVKVSSLIAHTSFRVFFREDWYFDSGCSKHMTWQKSYLKDLKPYSNNNLTFGDGVKGRIKGIRKPVYHGLPSLENVLLVEGLTSNLINIS